MSLTIKNRPDTLGLQYGPDWGSLAFVSGVLKFITAAGSTFTVATLEGGQTEDFGDGTALLPSITFLADLNTGLYRLGTDNIGITTGGTLRFDVSTTAVTSTLGLVAPSLTAGATTALTLGPSGNAAVSFTSNGHTLSLSGANLLSAVDNDILCGSNTFRLAGVSAQFFRSYAAAGDAAVNMILQGASLAFGAGGASSVDTYVRRSTTKTLVIDTDGALGALTSVNIVAPVTVQTLTATGSISAAAASAVAWNGRSYFGSPADGVVQALNNASTGFTRLVLGTNDATLTTGMSILLASSNTAQFKSGDGTTAYGFQTANLAVSGKVTNYFSAATAGMGLPVIYSEAINTSQSTNQTILTYTPASTAGRYEVSGVITTTSGTNTGTVSMTLDYVDSQGTTHTGDVMGLMDAAGGATAATKTGASKEFHTMPWKFTINNAGTNIVVKTVITGTVAYTASASITQYA